VNEDQLVWILVIWLNKITQRTPNADASTRSISFPPFQRRPFPKLGAVVLVSALITSSCHTEWTLETGLYNCTCIPGYSTMTLNVGEHGTLGDNCEIVTHYANALGPNNESASVDWIGNLNTYEEITLTTQNGTDSYPALFRRATITLSILDMSTPTNDSALARDGSPAWVNMRVTVTCDQSSYDVDTGNRDSENPGDSSRMGKIGR